MKNLMSAGTRCLLIHPQFSKNSALNYLDVCRIAGVKYFMPPLGLLTVAALLPQHWDFRVVDLNVQSFTDEHFTWADMVCTGGILAQQPGILAIVDQAHRFGKRVVVGGPDPTAQPEIYEMADYLVLGEGETAIPALLKDLEQDIKRGVYGPSGWADMAEPVMPRYDLVRFSDYLMVGIQFSRGCPYRCEFCNVIELFGRKVRAKTIRQVIHELQLLYQLGYRGHIFFVDDNFPASREHTAELLTEIASWSRSRKYPFYFQANATLNLAGNDRLLQLMREADFRHISIGIETPEDDVLERARKVQCMHMPIVEIIRKILSYGMAVDASFIMGFDNETDQSATLLKKCIQESGICMAMVGTLYALPHTELARRLRNEGRLFGESVTITDMDTEIDQMSSGLNFITRRARTAILRDYADALGYLYDPSNYYRRLTCLGLHLRPEYKHRPNLPKALKMTRAFLRICYKAGINRTTGALFWKMLFTVLLRNPKAISQVVSFAALYFHFARHSRFVIDLTREKITQVEKLGEDHYNTLMLSHIDR